MKLTILLPALNEEKTIGDTIVEIQKELEKTSYLQTSEILVVDNGSTDQTSQIAEQLGVRVVKEEQKGYGNALQTGIREAKGEFIIFGDCDRSYHFNYIQTFMERLENGADLVVGNRFQGTMEKGAMPFSHKYIGTPLISYLGRKFFKVNLSDFNCGLRGLRKESILELNLSCPGMEYASEMIVKSAKSHLKIEEIPIDFFCDKRDRKPHLRTIPDGIRHLKVLWKEKEKFRLRNYWLIIVMLLLFALKCWIVSDQIIQVKAYSHDDGLYAQEATSMVRGKWLGIYNDRTLSKGITAVFFIALAHQIGISYLMAQQFFYFLACLSLCYMLKHVTKNKWIILIGYIVLLFNPISYSDAFSFVYRDGVYTILTLFLIAFSFQIFFHYNSKMKTLTIWSILFGVVLAAIWLCREESSSLLPYLIIAFGLIIAFIIGDKTCENKCKRVITILGIPIGIVVLYIFIISLFNFKYYGRFVANDFTSKDFKDVYGALTRIKQENYIKRVPLNRESREKLYELSPKFKELSFYLDGGPGNLYKDKETKDYQEGFLYWAVRVGAHDLGYYKDAQSAKKFYEDLANEINALCDSGQIESYPQRSSLMAPFQPELLEELAIYIPKAFKVQLTYDHVIVHIESKTGPSVSFYEWITNNKTRYEKDGVFLELSIMKNLLKLYKQINPPLMAVSVICYLVLMVRFFGKKYRFQDYKKIFVLNGLLCMYLVRVVTVGYVAATEYTSALEKCQYLACSYPIQSLFSVLSIAFLIQVIYSKVKSPKTKA